MTGLRLSPRCGHHCARTLHEPAKSLPTVTRRANEMAVRELGGSRLIPRNDRPSPTFSRLAKVARDRTLANESASEARSISEDDDPI